MVVELVVERERVFPVEWLDLRFAHLPVAPVCRWNFGAFSGQFRGAPPAAGVDAKAAAYR
jgi:hypothetical protein